MEHIRFEEKQRFAAWVYALSAGIVVVVAGTLPLAAKDGVEAVRVQSGVLLLMALVLTILHLTTRVTNQRVRAHLGLFFPVMWRTVWLRDIAEARCVEYRPIRDCGGWGIRWGCFEGARCSFVNARGHRGVLLITHQGKRLLIGSQDPERLRAAIAEALRDAG